MELTYFIDSLLSVTAACFIKFVTKNYVKNSSHSEELQFRKEGTNINKYRKFSCQSYSR